MLFHTSNSRINSAFLWMYNNTIRIQRDIVKYL